MGLENKPIRVAITWENYRNRVANADFSQQTEVQFVRELVRQLFAEKKYAVIDHTQLKYFYLEQYIMVEGNTNVSLLSM